MPRTVGIDPSDQGTITVHNGRFGPYLKKEIPLEGEEVSSDTRSLDNEEMLLTVTLEECLTLLAQPKNLDEEDLNLLLQNMEMTPNQEKKSHYVKEDSVVCL